MTGKNRDGGLGRASGEGDGTRPAVAGGAPREPSRKDADASEVRYPEFHPSALKRSLFWATPTANSIRFVIRLVARVKVTGGEKIGHGPVILAPYHASKIDPLVVAVAIWNQKVLPHFLAKSSLFGGFVGRALVTMGQIPVLRASTKAGDSLIHAKRALAAGQTVVIYPQGTLTKDPDLWPQQAKTGVSRLSIETGVPVIPVAHWGLEGVMPVNSKRITPRPGHDVRVVFGDPLHPPARDALHATSSALSRGFADRVNAGIAEGVAELRGVELPQRFRDTIDAWNATHGSRSAEWAGENAPASGESSTSEDTRFDDTRRPHDEETP